MFWWLGSNPPSEQFMADQIVITEKTSQAKDIRTAVGSRYGDILPAEGHLFDLLEPEDVVPAWKRWSRDGRSIPDAARASGADCPARARPGSSQRGSGLRRPAWRARRGKAARTAQVARSALAAEILQFALRLAGCQDT